MKESSEDQSPKHKTKAQQQRCRKGDLGEIEGKGWKEAKEEAIGR